MADVGLYGVGIRDAECGWRTSLIDHAPAEPHDLAHHWSLDPDVVYLNHGSFGACPRPVLEAQTALRARLEAQPSRFFAHDLARLLAEARRALGRFVGASPADLAFVPNATTGLNSVLRSMPLAEGGELLVTDHEYNASGNVLAQAAHERGCRVVVAQVPFPIADAGAVVEAVLGAVTADTRLALLDHVTSQTALVFPIDVLVRELEGRGVPVVVDGAHAPGMLPLDVEALGASCYVGNCHKWLCAPKGVGFLWVRSDRREAVRPAVISHGANAAVPRSERFRIEFDWMGTDDPTAALSVPAAIAFLGGLLPGGWDAVRARNRALALEGRRILASALDVALPCPDDMIGSMATLPVPESASYPAAAALSALDPDPLHDDLLDRFGIEVPVIRCAAHPGRLLRISAQLYNRRADYQRLAEALRALL
jgi:isopenicillin-N epimerase